MASVAGCAHSGMRERFTRLAFVQWSRVGTVGATCLPGCRPDTISHVLRQHIYLGQPCGWAALLTTAHNQRSAA